MDHLGVFTELDDWSDPEARKEFRQEVADYHISRGLWDNVEEKDYDDLVTSFMSVRPDGIAFNAEDRKCVFLEFTPTDEFHRQARGLGGEKIYRQGSTIRKP